MAKFTVLGQQKQEFTKRKQLVQDNFEKNYGE